MPFALVKYSLMSTLLEPRRFRARFLSLCFV
ncbi:Uncharacterised protein [Vibrio cholerae]|nr:Uncharacterised protein [Vibrio cholerae]